MSDGPRVIRAARDARPWQAPEMAGRSANPVTVEQVEDIQRRAYEEGFAEGRRAGLAAGSEAVERLRAVLQALEAPLADLTPELEESLLRLAKALARQLVRRELKEDPAQVVGVVREAVAALPGTARHIRVHLHPEDAALVRELLAPEQGESPWRLVDDPVLARGDCRVETDASRVDAGLEQRLTALIAQALGGERGEDREEDDGVP